MDLNWDRYIKYRILPDFFETDLMIIMNQKKWNALSPKTREILQTRRDGARDRQPEGAAGAVDEGAGRAREARHQDCPQSAEASKRFVAGARARASQRMKERMEKAGGMENYERSSELFSPDPAGEARLKPYNAILYGMACAAGC